MCVFTVDYSCVPATCFCSFLVQTILDSALNYLNIAPAARIYFSLAYEKDQVFHNLCPFRTLDRSEASLQFWLRVHLRHKNAVELQRVDAIAFDYYFIQVV